MIVKFEQSTDTNKQIEFDLENREELFISVFYKQNIEFSIQLDNQDILDLIEYLQKNLG